MTENVEGDINIDELIAQQDEEETKGEFKRPENAGFPDVKPEKGSDANAELNEREEPPPSGKASPGEGTPDLTKANGEFEKSKLGDETIIRYVVAKGDSIRSIAKKFKTTAAAISKANNLLSPRHLVKGQVLMIRIKDKK